MTSVSNQEILSVWLGDLFRLFSCSHLLHLVGSSTTNQSSYAPSPALCDGERRGRGNRGSSGVTMARKRPPSSCKAVMAPCSTKDGRPPAVNMTHEKSRRITRAIPPSFAQGTKKSQGDRRSSERLKPPWLHNFAAAPLRCQFPWRDQPSVRTTFIFYSVAVLRCCQHLDQTPLKRCFMLQHSSCNDNSFLDIVFSTFFSSSFAIACVDSDEMNGFQVGPAGGQVLRHQAAMAVARRCFAAEQAGVVEDVP